VVRVPADQEDLLREAEADLREAGNVAELQFARPDGEPSVDVILPEEDS
jgi:hypothetical protein